MQGDTACGRLVVKFAGAHAYSYTTVIAKTSESVNSADIRNLQHNLPIKQIICFQNSNVIN